MLLGLNQNELIRLVGRLVDGLESSPCIVREGYVTPR